MIYGCLGWFGVVFLSLGTWPIVEPLNSFQFRSCTRGSQRKAVVADPAGRRAPHHFFGRVCFPPCSFFLVLAHFSLRLPLIFNLLMQSSITLVARVIHRLTQPRCENIEKQCNYYNDSYHTYGPCREKT